MNPVFMTWKDRLAFLRIHQGQLLILTPREETIVVLRMKNYPYEEIGKGLDICKERVRQIERKAVRKIYNHIYPNQ
jgi:RNA polymerase sigma factor (sigma-70 family)